MANSGQHHLLLCANTSQRSLKMTTPQQAGLLQQYRHGSWQAAAAAKRLQLVVTTGAGCFAHGTA
jgi:hypothetical protein